MELPAINLVAKAGCFKLWYATIIRPELVGSLKFWGVVARNHHSAFNRRTDERRASVRWFFPITPL
jgi:hypothetical protein